MAHYITLKNIIVAAAISIATVNMSAQTAHQSWFKKSTATAQAVQKKAAAQTIYLGYCPTEMPEKVNKAGLDVQATVSAAIRIPASKMLTLKGSKISKIRFATDKSMTSLYVWIRVGSLETTAACLQKVNNPVDGWNEVTLEKPYDIDGSDIYIGFLGKQAAGQYGIWFDASAENQDAGWLQANGGAFETVYGQDFGTLLIQGVVEGFSVPDTDLAIDKLTTEQPFYKSNGTITATFDIRNEGTQPVSAYTIGYRVDNAEPMTEKITTTVNPGEYSSMTKTINGEGLADGMHSITVYIDGIEAATQPVMANDTLSTQFGVYSTDYPKKILLEHFTTMACTNCPMGDKVLSAAVAGRKDIVWVAHHVGYFTDEFTLDGSYDLQNYGVNSAPLAMANRMRIPLNTDSEYPPFGIGYYNTQMGAEVVGSYLDYVAAIPAFVKTVTTCHYDKDTRQLQLTVEGERNALFSTFYPESNITVYLTENNLKGSYAQAGADQSFTHNHVIRAMLTDPLGQPIEWNGDKFTATFSTTLKSAWNADNMMVQTIVNRPFDKTTAARNNSEVLNAEENRISIGTAIDNINAENSTRTELIGIDGRRVNGSAKGLYIVKTTENGRTVYRKTIR